MTTEQTTETTRKAKASSRGRNDVRSNPADRHRRKEATSYNHLTPRGYPECHTCQRRLYVFSRSAIARKGTDGLAGYQDYYGSGTYPEQGMTSDRVKAGGSYEQTNLAPACRECNTARDAMGWREWFASSRTVTHRREDRDGNVTRETVSYGADPLYGDIVAIRSANSTRKARGWVAP